MASTAERVASRYAKEFSSPEQREDYLKEHPKADPSKHTVHKTEEHGKSDDGHGDDHAPKKSLKERLKAVAEKVRGMPAATKQFVNDPAHRKEKMKGAAKAIKTAPKTYLSNLKKAWQHEKQEFKDAGKGIAAIMKGGKASDHEKHAIKAVSKHLAITVLYSFATASGAGIAGTFALSMGKYVALNAASESLAGLYVLQKQGIIGEAALSLLTKFAAEGKGKDVPPEELLSAVILKAFVEQLEKGLSDEDILKILEQMDEDKSKTASHVATRYKVASRYIEAADANKELEGLLKDALDELRKWKAWSGGFSSALKEAQRNTEGLNPGEVWQDEFVAFWKPFDPIERRLMDISDEIYNELEDSRLLNEVSGYLDPPRGARIEDAISKVLFREHPQKGNHIAYPVASLEAWDRNFTKWVDGAIRGVGQVMVKAKRKGLI